MSIYYDWFAELKEKIKRDKAMREGALAAYNEAIKEFTLDQKRTEAVSTARELHRRLKAARKEEQHEKEKKEHKEKNK